MRWTELKQMTTCCHLNKYYFQDAATVAGSEDKVIWCCISYIPFIDTTQSCDSDVASNNVICCRFRLYLLLSIISAHEAGHIGEREAMGCRSLGARDEGWKI